MEHYGIIGWIVIGGLAGALAKLLMPGKDPGGCIITGALLAGWIARATGLFGPDWRAGFVGAVIGAFIILLIYRLIARRRP